MLVEHIGELVTNDPSCGRDARHRPRRGGRDRGRPCRLGRPRSGAYPRASRVRGSTPAGERRCRGSSTAIRTSCSPATEPRSSTPGCGAAATRPAGSVRPSRRPGTRPTRSFGRTGSPLRATRRYAPARPTSRSSPATGSTVEDEARLLTIAAELTDEVTFLGAHVVAARVRRAAPTSTSIWCAARCSMRARRSLDGPTSSATEARSTRTSRARSSTRRK